MNADEADKLAKAQQDAFLDKLVSALSMYWNALLAANGLFLAILSIIVILPGHALTVWHVRFIVTMVCANLLAILGLIFGCFRSERDHYLSLLQLGPNPPEGDKEMFRIFAQMKARILRKQKLRKICETFCEICALATIIASTVLLIVIALPA